MKYPMTKKSIMSKVALLTLVTMTSAYAHGNVAGTILKNFESSFKKIEKNLSDFFDSNNKTPYRTFATTIGNNFSECEKALESIVRNPQDSCATLAYEIADYSRQLFSAIYGVIRKYEGKDAKEVNNFKTDINRIFKPETAFEKIISKLEVLKTKAHAEGNHELVAQIVTIMEMIKRKKREWMEHPNKSEFKLGMGLITRMKC